MKIFLEKQKKGREKKIFEMIREEKAGGNLSVVAFEAKKERKRRKLIFSMR